MQPLMSSITHAPSDPGTSPRGTTGNTAADWLVWLRRREERETPPTPGRWAHTLAAGRCLFCLPEVGPACSWARRGARMGFLSGHLLNSEELRRRLEIPSEGASGAAEVLLAAYEAWGADAAQELEGAFAAVIWDPQADTLLAIRDAIGMVPIYYVHRGGELFLSSDIWVVLGHPDVPREINRTVVAEHLLGHLTAVEETFFAHVRRLPGAHRLRARGTAVTVDRYWNPLPPGHELNWLHRADLERFPELMARTVSSYLSVGPTAISLSAGIDSVSVAAFASEVAAQRGFPAPHALSVHFTDRECDESEGQRAIAGALEMPFQLVSFDEALTGRPLLEAATELTPAFPSPLTNLWEPLYSHLAGVARARGMEVMLTGGGGDEWLCVTPRLAADLIRSGNVAALWRLYQVSLRSFRLGRLPLARNLLWTFGLKQVLRDTAYRHAPGWVARRRPPVVLPDWLTGDPELRQQLRERLEPPPPRPPTTCSYLRDLQDSLQHPLVMMEMEELHYRGRGQGVTYFHPYWSRPLIDFLLRMPPELLNDGGRSKGFVRKMLAQRFPQLDFERHKKVISISLFQRLIAAQWPRLWERWADGSALERIGVVDGARFRSAMEDTDPRRLGYVALWMCTEAWLRPQL